MRGACTDLLRIYTKVAQILGKSRLDRIAPVAFGKAAIGAKREARAAMRQVCHQRLAENIVGCRHVGEGAGKTRDRRSVILRQGKLFALIEDETEIRELRDRQRSAEKEGHPPD